MILKNDSPASYYFYKLKEIESIIYNGENFIKHYRKAIAQHKKARTYLKIKLSESLDLCSEPKPKN